jgi:FAD/FMN-containing dehydrogenase
VALDAADPERATLGGAIAAAEDGGMAARFGRVRDQVLGLTIVNGDGRVTRCGGRVVKNVTGYDLCRLYAGSRGGLGIILEATVRVRPLPEGRSAWAFAAPDEATAFERALELRTKLPELAQVLIAIDAPDRVRVEAHAAGSAALVEALGREAALTMEGCERARAAADEADATAPERIRLAALPDRLPAVHAAVTPVLSPARRVVIDVLRGVRESHHPAAPGPFGDERRLDALLTELGASIDCPTDPLFASKLARRFPGQTPGGLELMQKLKAALDPAGILNPGMNVFG